MFLIPQISRLSRREAVLLRLLRGDRRHGPLRPHHPLPALVQAEPGLVRQLHLRFCRNNRNVSISFDLMPFQGSRVDCRCGKRRIYFCLGRLQSDFSENI